MIQSVQAITVKKEKPPTRKRFLRTIGYILLCAAGLFYLTPLFWLFDVSFRPAIEIFTVPPPLFQKPIWQTFNSYSLNSFVDAITKHQAPLAVLNSSILTVGGILATLLVVSLAAYAFACMNFPGRNLLFFGIIATMMLPLNTMLAPFYSVVRTLGLTDSLWGLIIIYSCSAYGFFLLRQYIIRLPMSLMEGASIDGANKLQIWWHIILPLTKPALAALAILQFRGLWNDFMIPMLLLKTEQFYPLTIRLQLIDQYVVNKPYGVMMAFGFIAVMIPVIFFLVFQRYFIEGLSGSVKG